MAEAWQERELCGQSLAVASRASGGVVRGARALRRLSGRVVGQKGSCPSTGMLGACVPRCAAW